MKTFNQYLEAIDTGLRGELEKGAFGGASYNTDQEKAVSAVVNLVMHAASTDMSRLMSMLKNISSRDPSMRAIYDQIDMASLRSAAKKHTGIEDMDSDNTIDSAMNADHMS